MRFGGLNNRFYNLLMKIQDIYGNVRNGYLKVKITKL